jgi:hypothetical protein
VQIVPAVLVAGCALSIADKVAAEKSAGARVGLLLEYQFEGNFRDGSGGDRDGKAVGNVRFATGRAGQCAELDGQSWIDTGVQQSDLGAEFTVECWVNPAAKQGMFAGIFGNETQTGNGFTLDQWTSQTNAFTANFGVGGGDYVRTDTVPLRPGVWQHVAYVKTTGGNVFYLNGIALAGIADRRPMSPSPGTLMVGRGGSGVPAFCGLIDEVRVWNRPLSQFPHAAITSRQTVEAAARLLALAVEPMASRSDARGAASYQVSLTGRLAAHVPDALGDIPILVAARRMDFAGALCEETALPTFRLTRTAGFRAVFTPPERLSPGCWNLLLRSRLAVDGLVIDGKPSALTMVVLPKPQQISPQHGFAAASGATSPVQSLRLEAPWRLLTDPENSGRQAGWFSRIPSNAKRASVPGTIQQVFPGYHGAAWYWTEFEGPLVAEENAKDRLRFGAVDHYAEIWLNGRRLGEHEGADAPFELDATAAVRPGKNLLAVRVINPAAQPVDGFQINEVPHSFKQSDHFVFGGNANSGGLLLPIELLTRPAVRISSLYCRPDLATGQVTLRLSVESDLPQKVGCSLAVTIERQDAGRIAIVCSAGAELVTVPGTSEFTLPLVVPQAKPWSPLAPNLYWATARLQAESAEGATVDACRERFGFCDFRVGADGYFRLNGRRLFLKSCHTVNNFPVAIGTAHRPDMFIRDLFYAKAMGFDMVRFLGGPPLPEQLRFCDEIGLMVYAEPRASWCLGDSPRMAERFDRSLSQMILQNRNHPCIAIWGLLNETTDGPVFRHAVASLPLVRALDDRRLVLLNSGRNCDGLPQFGSLCNPSSAAWEYLWGNESPAWAGPRRPEGPVILGDVHHYPEAPHTPEVIQMFRTLGAGGKPVFLSEYGVGSLVNCVRLARLHEQAGSPADLEDFAAYRSMFVQLAADLKRFGMDDLFPFPEDLLFASERLHAKHRTIGYNAIRSNPKLCGYSLTGIIDQPAGEGLLTEWREPKLGILDAMGDCLTPLRWCLFVEPMHAYAGRPFRIEAVMANDGVLPPGRYPCRFRIHGPQGSVWKKTSTLVVSDADSHGSVPLAIPVVSERIVLDVPDGVYQLAAELERGGAARGGRIDFRISRANGLLKSRHSVALLGVPGDVGSWLAARGVRCRPFDQLGHKENAVVLVGDAPNSPDRAHVWQELARRMAQGSAVVFLKPSAFGDAGDGVRWLPLARKGRCRESHNWVYHREDIAKPHPFFEGLAAGGIMDWYCYLQVTPQALFDGQDPPEEVIAAAVAPGGEQEVNAGAFRSGVITASYRFGAGRFIINTLRILENIDKNPAADRLLVNMIRYAAGLAERTPATLGLDFQQQLKAIGYR